MQVYSREKFTENDLLCFYAKNKKACVLEISRYPDRDESSSSDL